MHETLLPREFLGGRLRRLHPRDRAAFQAYRSLPELGRYQGWSPMSDVEAHAFLELVGDIGLYLSEDGTSGEVGFTLEPSSQGRGVAALAVREALQVLFAATSVTRVLAITDDRNLPSIKLLERVGFVFVDSRQAVFRGEPCTERAYALPRNDR